MLAAYSLYHLLEDGGSPEVLLAASSDKQAGRLFEAGCSFLRANPALDGRVHLREYVGEISRKDGQGKVIRMASDPSRAHGYNPSKVIADELHAWTTPSLRRAWGAFTTGGGARLSSQTFAITTAGEANERATSILGRLLAQNEQRGQLEQTPGLTVSRNHQARTLVYNYAAPTADRHDVVALKVANPATWISPAYLTEQAENPALTDAEVLQLHGCVWAAGETTWLPASAFAALHTDRLLQVGEQIVLGFDGSEKRDETWLVAATLDGHIEPLAAWWRPHQAADDWRIPRREVHAAVAAAFERYQVLELAVDPPGWYAEFDDWTDRHGIDTVIAFETRMPKRLAPACERTRTAILNQALSHGGPLSQRLETHIGNCVIRDTPYGTAISKQHPDSPKRIDGAIAAIIAHDRATWHQTQAPHQPLVAFG
jgi:phage terminase large subunit-like protein